MFKYALIVVVAFYCASVESDPQTCYECTLLDLDRCNSPLNTDDVGKSRCDIINIVGDHKNTTAKKVCYHVSATWIGLKISERGCYYAEMDGEDLCPFFKKTEANAPFTTDYKCSTCDTDNCNGD